MAPPESERATKRVKLDYTDTIAVIVGEEQKSYTIHKALICAKSEFFKTATSGTWGEALDKKIRLPEVEPSVFEVYMHWVYASEVNLDLDPDHVASAPAGKTKSYHIYAKLWIFADAILDHDLCNHVSNLTIKNYQTYNDCASPVTLQHIWKHTSVGSRLRRLHTDICSSAMVPTHLKATFAELPHELVMEFAASFLNSVKSRVLRSDGVSGKVYCKGYHIHKQGEVCGSP